MIKTMFYAVATVSVLILSVFNQYLEFPERLTLTVCTYTLYLVMLQLNNVQKLNILTHLKVTV